MNYVYIGLGIFILLIIWGIGSYLVVWNIEKPAYVIVDKKDGYEIREYKAYIVAETTVTGDYDSATREGFQIIADYIFGNNVSKRSISMTAPVLEEQTTESISMTSPVLETEVTSSERIISFVLPSEYTIDSLPVPNNKAVILREVEAHKVAVLSFTWYPTAARVEAMKEKLVTRLERDQQTITGAIQVARYNPPLSMPLVLRNEIIIPIE